MGLKHQLGVRYNTAWMLKHKLMRTIRERNGGQPLLGIVELDDAYLGGETSEGKRGGGTACPATTRISGVIAALHSLMSAWRAPQVGVGTIRQAPWRTNF